MLLNFEIIDESILSPACKTVAKAALEEILKNNDDSSGTSIKTYVANSITNIDNKNIFNNLTVILTLETIDSIIDIDPVNLFAKVLIPKEGLENFAKEAECKTAFTHVLRLVDETAITFY